MEISNSLVSFSLHVVDWTCQQGFFFLVAMFKKKKSLCLYKFSTSLTGVTNTRSIPKGRWRDLSQYAFLHSHAWCSYSSSLEKKNKKTQTSAWVKRTRLQTEATQPRGNLSPLGVSLFFAIFSQLRPNILHHSLGVGEPPLAPTAPSRTSVAPRYPLREATTHVFQIGAEKALD